MAQLKAQLIQSAYSLMRISGLTVSPTPDDQQLALTRLENMAAELAGRNITCGYNLSDFPDPSQRTGLERRFQHMFETNLAVRLVSDFGMEVPNSMVTQSMQSLSSVSAMVAADTIRQVMPGRRVPIGEANSLRRMTFNRFYRVPVRAPEDASLHHMYIGDINDYQEPFADYLKEGEDITSFTPLENHGIDVLSMEITPDLSAIDYQVEALIPVQTGPWQQLRIRIKTSTGRITTRIINFEIELPVTLEGLDTTP
ncbi:MAG: packaged DNA stabilization gp4 family protein [Nitrosomonadaceae bacterium]